MALEDCVGGKRMAVASGDSGSAADEFAAGASLVMGQTTEKTPVVLVRGYHLKAHGNGIERCEAVDSR